MSFMISIAAILKACSNPFSFTVAVLAIGGYLVYKIISKYWEKKVNIAKMEADIEIEKMKAEVKKAKMEANLQKKSVDAKIGLKKSL